MYLHDFIDGETVYLMSGKRLFIGVISDINCSNNKYISVIWNGNLGKGSPCYTSLYHTKKDALDNWRSVEMAKIEKIYKNYIK